MAKLNVTELVTEVTKLSTSKGRKSKGQEANAAQVGQIVSNTLKVLGKLPASVTGELLARYAR